MISRTFFFNTINYKPVIFFFECYLHKLVGLLSVEAVGETQHIGAPGLFSSLMSLLKPEWIWSIETLGTGVPQCVGGLVKLRT